MLAAGTTTIVIGNPTGDGYDVDAVTLQPSTARPAGPRPARVAFGADNVDGAARPPRLS